jgi:hypothetical protein
MYKPVAQQSIAFFFHYCVTLAAQRLQLGPVENPNSATAIADDAKILQLGRCLIDTFAANAKHVCDKPLRHGQLIGFQAIKRE